MLLAVLAIIFELALLTGLLILLVHITNSLIGGLMFGPFVPSPYPIVIKMLDLADLQPGAHIVELGSGDGRLCLLAAERGLNAVGIERDPVLVLLSRLKARRQGLQGRARFVWGNVWREKLAPHTDAVFLYALQTFMEPMYKKMQTELNPGTKIISHAFTFASKTPEKTDGVVRLYRIEPKS